MKYTIFVIAVLALVGCKSAKYTADHPFENSLGMKFVSVPGTKVEFCIWETRVKDYAAYAAADENAGTGWKTVGYKREDTHPVVNVSWPNAQAFCAWLTKKELAAGKLRPGQRYRLPTDVEWSIAVGLGKEPGKTPHEKHNGIKGVYPWGKEWPPTKGAGNYRSSLGVDDFNWTSPVGSFEANKHGIHDLGGNVWEWCEDKSLGWDPSGAAHILRGASFTIPDQTRLLSSYRYGGARGAGSGAGFRCVLAVD